jgi:hypothetical protein
MAVIQPRALGDQDAVGGPPLSTLRNRPSSQAGRTLPPMVCSAADVRKDAAKAGQMEHSVAGFGEVPGQVLGPDVAGGAG